MTLADAVVNAGLIVPAVTGERGHRAGDLVEQEIDLGAIIDVMAVSVAATIRPVRYPRRGGAFRPGPACLGRRFLDQPLARPTQLQAVLSTSRCMGAVSSRCGRGTSSIAARRLRVV